MTLYDLGKIATLSSICKNGTVSFRAQIDCTTYTKMRIAYERYALIYSCWIIKDCSCSGCNGFQMML